MNGGAEAEQAERELLAEEERQKTRDRIAAFDAFRDAHRCPACCYAALLAMGMVSSSLFLITTLQPTHSNPFMRTSCVALQRGKE